MAQRVRVVRGIRGAAALVAPLSPVLVGTEVVRVGSGGGAFKAVWNVAHRAVTGPPTQSNRRARRSSMGRHPTLTCHVCWRSLEFTGVDHRSSSAGQRRWGVSRRALTREVRQGSGRFRGVSDRSIDPGTAISGRVLGGGSADPCRRGSLQARAKGTWRRIGR